MSKSNITEFNFSNCKRLVLLRNINNIIRLNLFVNYLCNSLTQLFANDRSNRRLEGKKVFFITGYGRSGSMFLSSLLNRIPEVQVEHEPIKIKKIEKYAVVRSFYEKLDVPNYLRLKRQYINRIVEPQVSIYGEVNTYLRHHIVETSEIFSAKISYILRDGRNIVKSMMNRAVYTNYIDPLRPYPKKSDVYYKEFHNMSRFEKCCWAWATETKHVLTRIKEKAPGCKFLRFEEFTKDIDAVYNICNYFEIKHPERYIKEKDIRKKINPSPSYVFPKYNKWTRAQKEQFNRIAGEVNVSIGYKLV